MRLTDGQVSGNGRSPDHAHQVHQDGGEGNAARARIETHGGERFPLQARPVAMGLFSRDGRDLFNAVQLEEAPAVRVRSASRFGEGQKRFAISRLARDPVDDTTRLNKYLKSHGLAWTDLYTLRGAHD